MASLGIIRLRATMADVVTTRTALDVYEESLDKARLPEAVRTRLLEEIVSVRRVLLNGMGEKEEVAVDGAGVQVEPSN